MAKSENLWYVVHSSSVAGACQGQPGEECSTLLRSSIDTSEVQPNPEVLLVPCDIKDQEPARGLVRHLAGDLDEEEEDDEDEPPPVIVVLFSTHGMADQKEVLLSLRQFREAGAYDAIFHAQGSEETELLKSQVKSVVRRFYEEQEWHLEQFRRYLFLEAEQSLPGFPKMHPCPSSPPSVGAQIGGHTIVGRLGKGTFGDVFSALDDKNCAVAVKAIRKDTCSSAKSVHRIWCEFTALGRITHFNVAALRAVLHHREFVYLVMDLAGRSSLHRVMKECDGKIEIPRARRFFGQVASAVAHCHRCNIFHRDLNPENVMVEQDGQHVKIVDMGSAALSRELSSDICGTVPFMAPEVMRGKTYAPPPCDIFSCGVLLFEMLCGCKSMSKLLNWPTCITAPSKQRSEEYARLVSGPDPFLELRRALHSDPRVELLNLLGGAMHATPSLRLSSAQLASWQW